MYYDNVSEKGDGVSFEVSIKLVIKSTKFL